MRCLRSYEQFFKDVRESVKNRLARFGISEDELNKYLESEEDQIKSQYRHYSGDKPKNEMGPDSYYSSCVEAVSMCLEYCY